MSIRKDFAERRKDKRFKVKDPAFAVMYYSPTKIGQITDISRSGVAVRYIKNGDGSGELDQIDIFKSDFKFYMDNIKAKTVSDVEVIDKSVSDSKGIRRCGIQFENLSNYQISQIESFIQNYT